MLFLLGLNAGPRYTPGPQDRPINGGCVDIIRQYKTVGGAVPELSTPSRPTLPRRKVVLALYNYRAREHTDVSFRKGDRMEVLDDSESDWWKVRHLGNGKEGLIPWNFVAEELTVASEEYVHSYIFLNTKNAYILSRK